MHLESLLPKAQLRVEGLGIRIAIGQQPTLVQGAKRKMVGLRSKNLASGHCFFYCMGVRVFAFRPCVFFVFLFFPFSPCCGCRQVQRNSWGKVPPSSPPTMYIAPDPLSWFIVRTGVGSVVGPDEPKKQMTRNPVVMLLNSTKRECSEWQGSQPACLRDSTDMI